MKNEDKQALIEWLKPQIDELQNVSDEIPFGLDSDSAMHLNTMRVALAVLTAQPQEMTFQDAVDQCRERPGVIARSFQEGFNHCRAAILRNIEEAK